MQSVIKTANFFNWFVNLGGETSKANYEVIIQSVNKIPLQTSSLKTRSQEIKQKYNHNFQYKNERH